MADDTRFTLRTPVGHTFGPAAPDVLLTWAREGRIPANSVLEPEHGGPPMATAAHPALAPFLNAPPTSPGPLGPSSPPANEFLAAVVPYRNKPALVGYYAAIGGTLLAILLPALGAVLIAGSAPSKNAPSTALLPVAVLLALIGISAPASAVFLGVKGLRLARRDPRVRGRIHAWIAILGGGFGAFIGLLLSVGMTIAVLRR